MKRNKGYNYEEFMMSLDNVLDLIDNAIQNHKPLSLGRFGHGELAYIGWSYFPHWTNAFEPNSSYAGATASISTIKENLTKALKDTDIVGFHTSWGEAWEDREAAKLTSKLVQYLDFRPKHVCSAFITHEMIKSDRFWKCIENQKVALVGRRAEEASSIFKDKGINITYTTTLEGYEEIEKVYNDLSNRTDWDIVLLSTGIPANILAPRLANQTSRVVIDFGHALDKFIDGENFNYEKILKEWKEGVDKKMLVSIVMAVYNGEKFLKEAIDSAVSQTYTNIEVIIVNDASTDSTKNILEHITDKRVKVIHLQKNQGAANALNIGIKEAKGTWIAIQDADDNSYPTRIEEQIKYVFEHPQLVGVGTFIKCIRGSSDVSDGLLKGVAEKRNAFVSRKKIRDVIYWGCPLTHSSVMFSKDIFEKVGGYNTDFKIAYDYDLWLKLLEEGEVENVQKVLVEYRIHKKSLSNIDSIATLNEIQLASSSAICRFLKNKKKDHSLSNVVYRFLKKNKEDHPTVMVIGSQKGCGNYKKYIAPITGMEVEFLKYEDCNEQVHHIISRFKKGKVDAIIVLDGYGKEKILDNLKRNNLMLNEQVFNLYNFLN